jgi:hypothetical protein
VREILKTENVAGGKKLNVTIYFNDQGQLYINNAPMNIDQQASWTSGIRFLLQGIEQFQKDCGQL